MPEDSLLSTEKNTDLARDLCQQAARLYEQVDYAAARPLYEQALTVYERVLGEVHPDTARCLHGLGQVLMKLGDEAQARSLLERALSIQKQVIGHEHPDTAGSLHTLGELRFDQGDFKEGTALLDQAFKLRQRTLGAKHPDTLESMALLALMLARQGNRTEAERLLIQALSLCERGLGEYHRITARVLNGLGLFWAAKRDTRAQSRRVYERALSIDERLLGPEHPTTALVLNNLAALLADMKDYDAALPLLERSLMVHERIYGAESWRISFMLVNLADVHSGQGNHSVARPLLERALIIRERAWGARHPETVRCLSKLVAALNDLHEQGDESALLAGIAFYPCLASLEAAGGKPALAVAGMPGTHLDPDKAAEQLHHLVTKLEIELARAPLSAAGHADLETVHDLAQQADALYKRGDYTAAASRLEEALSLQERVLGEHHLDHVDLLKKLARAKHEQGQYSAVLPLIQRVANIHIQVLGPTHPTTALALSELWSRYTYEYGFAAALPLQEYILQSMEDALGPDDPFVIAGRHSYNQMKARLGEETISQEAPSLSRSEKREQSLAMLSSEKKELLAGLEDIDWHGLQHAYGPANDVPDLLRLLLSDDETVRDDAWQELYGNLWHQGDVYQATSYAVPFIIQLLNSEAAPDKLGLLAFLQAIATGNPWLSERHIWMEPVLARQGRDFQAEIEQAGLYARQAREAVGKGLSTYLACLHHPDPDVREIASALLCAFPEQAAHILPAFVAQVESEPEASVKARLLRNLGIYLAKALTTDERTSYVEWLERLVRSQESRIVRFAAAIALAQVAGDETAAEAIEILEQVVATPDGLYPASKGEEGQANYLEDTVIEGVCAALACIGAERRIPILTHMLERTTVPDHAHHLAVLLLDTVFLEKSRIVRHSIAPEADEDTIYYDMVHPVSADGVEERIYPRAEWEISTAALTMAQRHALQTVLDNPTIWGIRSNLLEMYGLPASGTPRL